MDFLGYANVRSLFGMPEINIILNIHSNLNKKGRKEGRERKKGKEGNKQKKPESLESGKKDGWFNRWNGAERLTSIRPSTPVALSTWMSLSTLTKALLVKPEARLEEVEG